MEPLLFDLVLDWENTLDSRYFIVDTAANILASTPASAKVGFSSDTHKFYLYDGSDWQGPFDTTSALASYYVQKVGDTMTGPLFIKPVGTLVEGGLLGVNTDTPEAALDIKAHTYDPGASQEFTGSGLNDAVVGGSYSGETENPTFTVIIDGVNTIKTSALNAGGSGYNVNDTFTVDLGTVLATGTVTGVSSGVVTTYTIDTKGSGYWVANGFSTTATSGGGTGLKINVTAVVDTFKWRKDEEAYTEGVVITGASQNLKEGITVTFGAITGHNSVNNFWKHHTAGDVAPVTKDVCYGVVATDIGGTGTKYWTIQNLGADHQATAVSDNTEPSAGWYWQFNRKQGYQYTSSRTPSTAWDATNDNTYTGWDPAKDPCTLELGTGWRLPTYTEYLNADASDPPPTTGWLTRQDAYNSVLKLHAAGYLSNSSGGLNNRGDYGSYWSSTQYNSTIGRYLNFDSSSSAMYSNFKAFGLSVRCLRDDAPVADQWVASNFQATVYDPVIFRDESGNEVLHTYKEGKTEVPEMKAAYFSSDDTVGISTTFLDNDGNTITTKDGIIVSKVAP